MKSLELLEARQDAELVKKGFRSFKAWVKEGRVVWKGSKATRWDSTGLALFHRNQTTIAPEGYCEGLDQSEEDGFEYEDDGSDMGFDIMDFGCRD